MPRSEAPEDSRPYVRLSTDLPLNLKLAAIDDPAAGWAYVVSICMAGQSLSDGHFNVALTIRTAGVEKTVGKALAQQGLWHLPGHDCDRCEQPKAGEAVIHDYLRHQRSASEVEDLTAKRRAAGREGAKKRWDARRAARNDTPSEQGRVANAMASAMANAEQDPWQNDGTAMAEEKRGEEKREEDLPSEGLFPPPPAGEPARAAETKPKKPARALPIPDDFAITADMREWASEKRLRINLDYETEKFVDYWRGQSGKKDGAKSDWPATWRNWMRRENEKAPRPATPSNVVALPSAGNRSPAPQQQLSPGDRAAARGAEFYAKYAAMEDQR